MGRVTFQTPSIKTLLDTHVVKTYCNAFPGFSGTPLKRGKTDLAEQFAAWWPSGTADSNVITLLTTADGVVLHMVRGYLRPRDFERELRWALALADEVRWLDGYVTRAELIRKRHQERLDQLVARFGPGQPVDTTRPPAPTAFDPDRFPFAMIANHRDVLANPGDVGLLPTKNGHWDRSKKALATVPQPDMRGDGLAPMAGVRPEGGLAPPAPATPAPVAQQGANVGGVSAGGNVAQGPPPPRVPQNRGQANTAQQQRAQANAARAQAAANRYQAQDAQRRARATAAATSGRGLAPGTTASAVMGLASVAPTSQDFNFARQALATQTVSERALSFYEHERCHVDCERVMLQELNKAGPAACYRLFEATRGPDAAAAFKALAALTGRSYGQDEAAWRSFLESLAQRR